MLRQGIIILCTIGFCVASLCLNSNPFPYYWASWSSCTKTCGGGHRVRHCYYDNTIENERCGTSCSYGGEFYGGSCHCRHGTHGPCCDDILECNSNPCKNGGTCHEYINYYTCDCLPGTTGPQCDDILDCVSNPCKNGGTCSEHVGSYTCICPAGTTDINCEDILECESNPCLNGGTCIEHINSYSCVCPTGTTGYNCMDIHECDSSPCQNGGTCNEMVNMYNCSCTDSFIGDYCHKDLFHSHDHKCRTGNQGCYVAFRLKDTWAGAEEFCEARQGHLVVPNNIDEALFLENYLESMRERFPDAVFWIGGQKSSRGRVQWLPGQSSDVYRWPDGTDDHPHGTECVVMDGTFNFEWQSRSCDTPTYFICEERYVFSIVG